MNRRALMVLLGAFLLGLAIWLFLITAVLIAAGVTGAEMGEVQP